MHALWAFHSFQEPFWSKKNNVRVPVPNIILCCDLHVSTLLHAITRAACRSPHYERLSGVDVKNCWHPLHESSRTVCVCVCPGNDCGVVFSLERQIHENSLTSWNVFLFLSQVFFLCVSLFFKKKKCDTYAAWQEAASTKRCVLGFFPAICLEKVKTKQNLSGCCYPFTLVNVICKSLSNVISGGGVVLSEWNRMRLSHRYHEPLLFLRPWLIPPTPARCQRWQRNMWIT